jgi:hypothetical protein
MKLLTFLLSAGLVIDSRTTVIVPLYGIVLPGLKTPDMMIVLVTLFQLQLEV